MAGDWIKIEKATSRKPEVLRLSDLLGIHPDHAFGLCVRWWSWCDDNMTDGHATSVTNVTLDTVFGHAGFASALIEVGWLRVRRSAAEGSPAGSLEVPHFDRHLSDSAKNRALSANRKQKQRVADDCAVTEMSRSKRDKSGTREEKRREESISLSLAAAEAAETKAQTLKTWRLPPLLPPPVAEALDRWQAFRVSVDGRPMPDMQLEASWLEMSRKGWGPPQVEASVEFSIRVGAKNLLDPANDREAKQSRAAPPAKKNKYAPVEM